MQVIWLPQAARDLEAVRQYIAVDNPKAAARTGRQIHEAVGGLSRFPGKGHPRRVPGTRELVIPGTPYVVPYRVLSGVVQVIAVLHSSRRWPDTL